MNGLNHRGQRRGNLRRSGNSNPLVTLVGEIVQLRAKSAAHGRGAAAEVEAHAAAGNRIYLQVLRLQPFCDGGDVVQRDSKALAHLLRREPVVVVAGGGILLVPQKLLEGLLHLGCARQHQGEVLEARFGGHGSRIRLRPTGRITTQRHHFVGIYRRQHAIRGLCPH